MGLARMLGLPTGFGWILLVAMLGWIGWLVRRRELDIATATVLLTGMAFVTLTAMVRVVGGTVPVELPRYSHNVGVLFLLALAPHLRIPRERPWAVPVVAALAGLVVVVNAVRLDDSIATYAHLGGVTRNDVEAVICGSGVS